MRGNLDRGIGFRTVQLTVVAVSVILVLCMTTGIIGAFGKTDDGSYVLQDRSTAELMGDFGVICFDTLNVQTHLHRAINCQERTSSAFFKKIQV